MSDNTVYRLIMLDDNRSFIDGLAADLQKQAQLQILDVCYNGKSAIDSIRNLKPDVALVDLDLPDISGIEVIETLVDEVPGVDFLVLSSYEDNDHLLNAFQVGATGYIVKDKATADALFDAIVDVKRGESPMSPGLARRLISIFRRVDTAGNKRLKLLTPRELEVLKLHVDGFDTHNVAEQLGIAYNTCRVHQRRIFDKLKVNTMLKAVQIYNQRRNF